MNTIRQRYATREARLAARRMKTRERTRKYRSLLPRATYPNNYGDRFADHRKNPGNEIESLVSTNYRRLLKLQLDKSEARRWSIVLAELDYRDHQNENRWKNLKLRSVFEWDHS